MPPKAKIVQEGAAAAITVPGLEYSKTTPSGRWYVFKSDDPTAPMNGIYISVAGFKSTFGFEPKQGTKITLSATLT